MRRAVVLLLALQQQPVTHALVRPFARHRTVRARERTARTAPPVCELGFQFDPLAAAGPTFCAVGFVWLQLKIQRAETARESRDAAAEALRATEVRLLAGEVASASVEDATRRARDAVRLYEQERVISFAGVSLPLRIPDPTTPETRRLLEQQAQQRAPQEAPPPTVPQQALQRAEERRPPPSTASTPTLKDGAVGLVFVLQIALLALLSSDASGAPRELTGAPSPPPAVPPTSPHPWSLVGACPR